MFVQIDKENLKIPLPDLKLEGCWVSGGAIRDSILNKPWSDIDVFAKTTEELDRFISRNGLKNPIYSDHILKTFIKDGNKIQLIYRPYESEEACLDSFDFTICQFLYTGDHLLCNPESLIHIFQKRLVIHKLGPFVIDSMRRMQKYIQKGYTICNGGLLKIVEAIRSQSDQQIRDQTAFYPSGKPRIIRFD